MEFIRAFEKAQGLGVTKEEFISLWEKECKAKSKNETHPSDSGGPADSGGLGGTGGPRDSGGPGSSINSLSQSDLQQVKDELKQSVYLQLQNVFTQQMEKHRQQFEQVNQKNEQAAEEFRLQFQVLYNHVSNTMEAQANSLKLHFIQELDLLRNDLMKMIEDNGSKQEADIMAMFNSSRKVTESDSDDKMKQNIDDFSSSKHKMINDLLNNDNFLNYEQINENVQKVKLLEEDDMPPPAYDWQMMDGNDESGWYVENDSEYNVENDSGNEERLTSWKSLSKPKRERDWDDGASYVSGKSVTSLPEEPVEATGFYAKAISSQMKQGSSMKPGSASSHDKPAGVRSKDTSSLDAPVSSSSLLPGQWSGFTINNIDQFSCSSEGYFSPYLHSDTKSWKSRLYIKFDSTKHLKIQVRISKGESDVCQRWPLKFAGNGYIYNRPSRRFTQIWQLLPSTCQKPSSGEFILPVKACLSTLRGVYPNITYQKLEDKHYNEGNKMTFKWTLKNI